MAAFWPCAKIMFDAKLKNVRLIALTRKLSRHPYYDFFCVAITIHYYADQS